MTGLTTTFNKVLQSEMSAQEVQVSSVLYAPLCVCCVYVLCVCVVCVCARVRTIWDSVYNKLSCSCTFEGSHDELSAHLETCSYEQLKGFLGRTDDHIQQLQDELKKKDEVTTFAELSCTLL